MERRVGLGQALLGERDGRLLLEAEEAGEEARPPLAFGQGEERLQHVHDVGPQLAQGLDGQRAGLPVRIALREQQGGLGLGVPHHPEAEHRRPSHGGGFVDQQPFEDRPPGPVPAPPKGHCEVFAQPSVSFEALLHGEVVVRLAVHEQQEERPLVDVRHLEVRLFPRGVRGGVGGASGEEEKGEGERGKLSSGHGEGDATTRGPSSPQPSSPASPRPPGRPAPWSLLSSRRQEFGGGSMAAHAVTLRLPAPLYDLFQGRAERAHRSLEAELLDAVATAAADGEELPRDLTKALGDLELLNDEELWRAAQNRFSGDARSQLEALNFKQQQETLTQAESEKLEQLVQQYDQAVLLRAEAARLLKRRGHDVSKLLTAQ